MLKEIRREDIEAVKAKKENNAKVEDTKEVRKYLTKGFAVSFAFAFIGGMLIGIASELNKK
jgi:F0F1-type ATP synthase assembly protein I